MATDKIELEIVTPRGLALKASVDEVTTPSIVGEFGLMPGHLPVLAAVRTGVINYRIGQEQSKCAVGEGFAEGGPAKLLVLTEDYITKEGVEPVSVRAELAEVEAQLDKATHDVDAAPEEVRRLIIRENWLAAQLELIGDPPAPTMNPVEDFGADEDDEVHLEPDTEAATGR
ncbi:MAG TPA: ATP synthase F1 subunit epsilon [Polyangiaceae bacterium]|jgi:F-type H+-transporting ATPase subunit epsilon|nr:ATP synthase F1 subunit epsilon [Polyangiaceae bacterium]